MSANDPNKPTPETISSEALATTGPRMLVDPRTNQARGVSELEREDLIIPRIAIGQSTSARVQDGEFKAGTIYNTITGEAFVDSEGRPKLRFIPLLVSKSRILWDKKNKNNQLCRSDNSKVSIKGDVCKTACPFNAYDFMENDEGERQAPLCSIYYNFLSWTSPYRSQFPASISFGKTNVKAGKQFNSFMMMTGEDIFAREYELSTERKENEKGIFHVFKVKPIGSINDEGYKKAEILYDKFAGADFKVHDESAEAIPF